MTQLNPAQRPAFYDDLALTLDHAWQLLERGVADRRSPFHQASVATVTPESLPSVRTVVLRGADRSGRTVRFHTDRRSRKAAELAANPAIAVHFYDHGKKIQLRLSGHATLQTDNLFSVALWRNMRDMSKACYRQPQAPGAAVDDPVIVDGAIPLTDDGGLENFVAVTVRIERLEWLYLAARGHRRAVFDLAADPPTGQWLAP